MSFLMPIPLEKNIEEGAYEIALFEKCSFDWNFNNNYSLEPRFRASCTDKRYSENIKYSPLFHSKNPICSWYLLFFDHYREYFSFRLVLKSAKCLSNVKTKYKARLLPDYHHSSPSEEENLTFSQGQSSPEIRLFKVAQDMTKNPVVYTHLHVDIEAEVERITKSNPLYPKAREKLITDFNNLLKKNLLSDIAIKVKSSRGQGELQAHQAVLAARSPVFAAMLEHDMLEKNERAIDIIDFDADAVSEMLSFMYSGSFSQELSCDSACELLRIADKYDISDLKVECQNYLIKEISEANAFRLLRLADVCSADDLKDESMDFIGKNFHSFKESTVSGELQNMRESVLSVLLSRMSYALNQKDKK